MHTKKHPKKDEMEIMEENFEYEEMDTDTHNCGCGKENTSVLNTILLVLILIIVTGHAIFALSPKTNIKSIVRTALLEHEYEKIGSKDAYDTETKLRQLLLANPRNPENLQAMKDFISQLEQEGTGNTIKDAAATAPTDQETPKNTKTLDKESMISILKNAAIDGNKDGEIVFVEYADLECPFCIMQHNENQISEKVKKEFGDKLVYIFKNHRGVNHRGTEIKALGTLCAQEVGGDEAYTKFYQEIFAGSTTSSNYPASDLAKIAKKIGLDEKKWQACVDSKTLLPRFESDTSEAIKYGLRGTPGVLIFNRKTGEYTTLTGAQPYEEFSKAVSSLIKK